MNIKVKQTRSKDQGRKEKKNKTPNITNKRTNSNKNCKNIKSKKSNDNNKDKKKQEQAPLKPAIQAVNMAGVQLGGGAPRLHHLVGHVVTMSKIKQAYIVM